MATCYFFKLPLELRVMIYTFVLRDLTPWTYSWPDSHFAGKQTRLVQTVDSIDRQDRRIKTLYFPSPLAAINRQLQEEVKECSYTVYQSYDLWVDVPMYPPKAETTDNGRDTKQDLRALVDFRRHIQNLYPEPFEPRWHINFMFSVPLIWAHSYGLTSMKLFFERPSSQRPLKLGYSFESRIESFVSSKASSPPAYPNIHIRERLQLLRDMNYALTKREEDLDRLYGLQRLTVQERELLKPLDLINY